MLLDFNNIINKLLPISKRKDKTVAFLYLILHPLKAVNILFNQYKIGTNYKLIFNGQVIYLEHYLNDLYDNTQRRIYIQDTANAVYNYIYNQAELLPPLMVYNANENIAVYLINNNEAVEQIDFIVMIPSSIIYNEKVIRSQIDYYKSAGKKYKIETF
tara:strand:- start:855 stop:1328 length:474 start_codon:yes stop_codon:yes gene_type:complete